VIRFTFWEAKDLRNVEAVTSGKSDPYVRVLSGTQVRAQTKVVDNNLNPEWGETLYVPVHSTKENMVLEVMDWNARTPDKSLGITTINMVEMIRQHVGNQSVDPDRWYESVGGPSDK
jgi:Ca2+-dependent lipid-binding protein